MHTKHLPHDSGRIDWETNLFSARESRELMRELEAALPWRQFPIRMFGQMVDQPRRVCALAASPTLTYTYSGVEIRPEPWQTYPALLRVKERVERALGGGASFNSVLCNLYRDGRDYMGYHADDEPELRPSTAGKTAADAHVTIASVSFGAERRFLLRAKDSHAAKLGKAVVEFKLAPGTLLVMGGNTQTYWKHSIPKMLAVKQARVNLTFRTIYPRVR